MSAPVPMSDGAPSGSRLAGARSPFLRHGAEQPVAWFPWGEEAFAAARAQDRPVLLDIGAVWCHWCHVMDAESYEDEETAALINELFVPVKVDRDERPDVDARYQRAVQLLTGQGGWPLTAFLTPEGEVFHGGTYFPPVDAHGRPSFRRVLREVARIWRDERDRALHAATGIGARLDAYVRAEAQPGDPTLDLLREAREELAQSFDFRYGGFGRAPKFPHAGGLDLLIDAWLDDGVEWAQRIVTETLDAMTRGGIYDQIGGGFHRYATDARWLVPHFEKMAYDNGVLLETCARAAVAFDRPDYAAVVDETVAYYEDVAPALVAAGGFPASQDADFGFDNDGDYWTWTLAEVQAAVGGDADLLNTARLAFGLDDPGSAMHLDRERHVLFRALPAGEIAARTGVPEPEVEKRIARVRALLKAARDRRPRPWVDETLYTGWVSLVAAGHLAAAARLGHPRAGGAALRALERLWSESFVEARGAVHRAGDPASGFLLDDQALFAGALFDAWHVTQDASWLERAGIVASTFESFRDPSSGVLGDRPAEDAATVAALERPHASIADAPSPSGNGAAALVLLRLAAATGNAAWRASALDILRQHAGSAARLTSSAATWLKALAWALQPVTTVVVIDDAAPADSALFRTALRDARPRTVVRHFMPGTHTVASLPPELAAMVDERAPRAYLCAGRTCALPVDDPAALQHTLLTFRG